MRTSPPHIRDELQFFLGMLIGVMVRTAGAIHERGNGSVVSFPPTVYGGAGDIETVHGSLNGKSIRIFDN